MTPEQYNRLTDYLCKLYSVDGYRRGAVRYPVVVYAPDADQVARPDSVMGTISANTPRDHSIYDYGHLHSLQNRNPHIYNGTTFDLARLETHPLTIHACVGSYFDMLATSGALEAELRQASLTNAFRLPLRSQLHRTLSHSQALWRGAGRGAMIGGACLLVFKHPDGDYRAMLARRSVRNATDPGFFHLFPAFVFQRLHGHPSEFSLTHSLYRELLEELFNAPEALTANPATVDEHPVIVDLQARIANGRAGLYLTGIILNLLNLRPEIGTLLLIHDADWWASITAPDSPTPLNAHSETDGGQLSLLPMLTDEALLAQLPPDVHLMMPAQGAVGMWLALDLARNLLK